MSYIQYPRLHFSGKFKASPSTINNAPDNYSEKVYPEPDALDGVELYWNPKGDGGFELDGCTVTRVDYDENHSATDASQDPIIGQPVLAVKGSFPLPAAMVDLDPYQQNVSEIWAMSLQIGGASANAVGAFSPISFNAIWGQCQSADAPHSSASGSGVYQSTLKGVTTNGDDVGSSPFLKLLQDNPAAELSVNFNVYKHNNNPPIYSFNASTFATMAADPNPVPQTVLDQMMPMQKWVQNIGRPGGDLPTEEFSVFMLQQLLEIDDYNAHVDKIIATAKQPYQGSTPENFLYGAVTGTVGQATSGSSDYFVNSRMLCPQPSTADRSLYFAPFVLGDGGTSISLNLGNALPTTTPDFTPYTEKFGTLELVAFPGGTIDLANAVSLAGIPYEDSDFIQKQAGFFTASGFSMDCSQIPLGITSTTSSGTEIVANENPLGYYMRADQFVYRMNPGEETGPTNPRGSTNSAAIHVTQWGKPAPEGLEIVVSQMLPEPALEYTSNTVGTGGTRGITNVSCPQTVVSINGNKVENEGERLAVTLKTDSNGVATFELGCTPPGNPRKFIDGQVYFLEYEFGDSAIQKTFVQDVNDKISILVYDEITDMAGADILAKWGRLYKIMYFLTDTEKITEISFRNIIKQMLEKPFSDVKHMPLTRDLGESARNTVIQWIDSLNNPTPPPST